MKKNRSTDHSDEALAARAARGDQAAFAGLVERYSARIFALAYRFLNDRGDAEDAVQEVFIKVYRALPESRLDLPFKPWIYRIATNECINRSKRRRERVADVAANLQDPPDATPLPAELVIDQELKEALLRAINALPERYRPVVMLRYAEELSFKEIGEVLNIPEGTAKTYFFRAKDQLRDTLSGLKS